MLKVSGSSVDGVIDEVAAELPVRLELNNEPLVTLLCTPSELKELAVGFLLAEGILRERTELAAVDADASGQRVSVSMPGLKQDWKRLFETRAISSGCGKGMTFTNYDPSRDKRMQVQGELLTLEDIRRLLAEFRTLSKLYLETGGVHSAALSDGKTILLFSEDIGRHNAVDKLIGKAFLAGISLNDKVLLTSGRVTSEIITKSGRNRIPLLISRAAPSCMAISYAEDLCVTLVGFARGDRMNIYSWPNRIRM